MDADFHSYHKKPYSSLYRLFVSSYLGLLRAAAFDPSTYTYTLQSVNIDIYTKTFSKETPLGDIIAIPSSLKLINKFALGLSENGHNINFKTDLDMNKVSDLSIIFGHPGNMNTPLAKLRRSILEHTLNNESSILFCDGDIFKFTSKEPYIDNALLLHSDTILITTNTINAIADYYERWSQLALDREINLKPWRKSGSEILIIGQRSSDWFASNESPELQVLSLINGIREFSDRPIKIRPHPFCNDNLKKVKNWGKDIYLEDSSTTSLKQSLKNIWASVIYNTTSGIGSIIEGIPVFYSANDCICAPVAHKLFSKIEDPIYFDRSSWLNKLSFLNITRNELHKADTISLLNEAKLLSPQIRL